MVAVQVFISYSHKDEALMRVLRDHLAPLRRQGLIADWHDRRIPAGDHWDREISEHLERCQVVLLLLSASFFASDYIDGAEMAAALRLHAVGKTRAIPIILRPVDWERSVLGGLQALPTNAKPVTSWRDRHQAFRDVARGLGAALTRLGSAPATAMRAIGGDSPRPAYFLNHTSFLRADVQAEFRARTGVPIDHYDIRVVLDAEEPDMLEAVDRIEYILDPAYPEPVQVRTAERDRHTKFLLKELANGEYLLRATVYFVDNRPLIHLERYITLWRSGPELQ
jgi:TIR domain